MQLLGPAIKSMAISFPTMTPDTPVSCDIGSISYKEAASTINRFLLPMYQGSRLLAFEISPTHVKLFDS